MLHIVAAVTAEMPGGRVELIQKSGFRLAHGGLRRSEKVLQGGKRRLCWVVRLVRRIGRFGRNPLMAEGARQVFFDDGESFHPPFQLGDGL